MNIGINLEIALIQREQIATFLLPLAHHCSLSPSPQRPHRSIPIGIMPIGALGDEL
jgi:hypothetical protein